MSRKRIKFTKSRAARKRNRTESTTYITTVGDPGCDCAICAVMERYGADSGTDSIIEATPEMQAELFEAYAVERERGQAIFIAPDRTTMN